MTELGEIPSEWEVKNIGEVAKFQGGYAFKSSDYVEDGIRLVKITNVQQKNISWNEEDLLPVKYLEKFNEYKLQEDDVVIAMTRPIISTGIKVCKIEKRDLPCLLNQRVGRFIIKDSLISKYLYNYCFTDYFINKVKELCSTTGQPNISANQIESILITIPSVKEQEKIAAILSTVDEQIDNVDALIEKNKELKKGLMQTLLTKGIGHTKFKKTDIGEIPEEWEVKNLSEVVWYQEGPGLRKWQFTSAGIKVINVTNLVGNYLDLSNTSRYIDESEVEKKYKHFLIDENDIVVASSGNSWGKVSVVRKRDLPLLMNTSVIRFKSMEEERLSTKYLLQFLKSDAFKKQIALLITGSAQPNFGPYHLDRTKIATPNINEQLKIASILLEADEKIKKYENNKQKLEELKKGLMQQLLTGKIRVI